MGDAKPLVRRYLKDIPFKTSLSLHLSLAVNLLYAGMNGFSGFFYRSVWFATLAVYYLFLAVMRFLLVRHAHRHHFGKDKAGGVEALSAVRASAW